MSPAERRSKSSVARDIVAQGGRAEAARVDALDECSVQQHADAVAARAGRIDIAFNAVGIAHVQGIPLLDLALDDYFHPVQAYTRTHFITAKAVAPHMPQQKSGVILTLATPAGRMPGPGFLGHSVACAGIEALTRHLAGELGSHARQVFDEVAARGGTTVDAMLAGAMTGAIANLTCGMTLD